MVKENNKLLNSDKNIFVFLINYYFQVASIFLRGDAV